MANPVMLVTVVLTLGVIFVNGWTDAPNVDRYLYRDTEYECTACNLDECSI